MKYLKLFGWACLFLYACTRDGVKNDEILKSGGYIPSDSLINYLSADLKAALDCREITYIADKQNVNSDEEKKALENIGPILWEQIKDSSGLNQRFFEMKIPAKWIDSNRTDESCEVFIACVFQSENRLIQAITAYVPSVDDRYRIIIRRKTISSDWEVVGFGFGK